MMPTIDRAALKEKVDSQQPLTLVETLPEVQFRQGHLPGAVNLPPDKVKEHAPEVLPDRDAEVVVYCGSSTCNASEVAAQELQRQGYRHVRRYVGGKQDWINAGLPLEGAPHETATAARDTVVTPPASAGAQETDNAVAK